MDDIFTKLAYTSLKRYFTALSQFGYKSYADVNYLLMLLFIQDFFINYNNFLTDSDYNELIKSVECLSGKTCLIPYQYYKLKRGIIQKSTNISIALDGGSTPANTSFEKYKTSLVDSITDAWEATPIGNGGTVQPS